MELITGDNLLPAAEALRNGGLVVVPTRRWYMICADATNADACERIFEAKMRPRSKSLAYVLPARELAAEQFTMNPAALRLAEEFWPGDLALLLPWRDEQVGAAHAAVGSTNALVVHEEGVLGELARVADVPVGATTINISGPPNAPGPGPAITLTDVRDFATQRNLAVAYAIDGGVCPLAHHLTIVDCSTTDVTITRQGLVAARAVATALSGVDQARLVA